MAKPKFYPQGSLVRVRWVDSAALSGWRSPATVFEPGAIESVGMVVQDNSDQITLTTSISADTGAVFGPLTIPKGSVVEMEDLV